MNLETLSTLAPSHHRDDAAADAASEPDADRLPLTIRPARREDMPRIAAIVRSSADWYRPIVDPRDLDEHDVDEAWQERNFAIRDFYLARVGDEAVGTISIQYFGDVAYLGYIYLDVAHVGRGIGRRLIRHAERLARRAGVRSLVLLAHPEARWARRAYLKYGFEIIERDRERILDWRGGLLEPYYEQGFELYRYPLEARVRRRPAHPTWRPVPLQPLPA